MPRKPKARWPVQMSSDPNSGVLGTIPDEQFVLLEGVLGAKLSALHRQTIEQWLVFYWTAKQADFDSVLAADVKRHLRSVISGKRVTQANVGENGCSVCTARDRDKQTGECAHERRRRQQKEAERWAERAIATSPPAMHWSVTATRASAAAWVLRERAPLVKRGARDYRSPERWLVRRILPLFEELTGRVVKSPGYVRLKETSPKVKAKLAGENDPDGPLVDFIFAVLRLSFATGDQPSDQVMPKHPLTPVALGHIMESELRRRSASERSATKPDSTAQEG